MDSTLSISSSSMAILPVPSPPKRHIRRTSLFGLKRRRPFNTVCAVSNNGAVSRSFPDSASSTTSEDVHRRRGRLESLFCYDKPIPEEKIEKPIGLSLAEKIIGDNPRCPDCQSKGCGGAGNIMCPECGGRGHLGVK